MAERRAGGPAGAHQAATAAIAWQQVLNGAGSAGIVASANRVPMPAPELGQVVALAAPRAAFPATTSQRHQLGSAGRAALHMARQVRPDQLHFPGTMETQVLQIYQLGLNDPIYGAATLYQQNQHQHHQQQQYQQEQQQQQQVLQHRQRAQIVAAVPVALGHPGAFLEPHQLFVPQPVTAGSHVVVDAMANPLASGMAQAVAVRSLAQHIQPVAHPAAAAAALAAVELQQQQQQQQQQHHQHQYQRSRQRLGQALLQQQQQQQRQLQLQLLQQIEHHQQQQQQLALQHQHHQQPAIAPAQPIAAQSPHFQSQQQQQVLVQPQRHRVSRGIRPLSAAAAIFGVSPSSAPSSNTASAATIPASCSSAPSHSFSSPVRIQHHTNSSPAHQHTASSAGAAAAVVASATAAAACGGGDSSTTDFCELDLFDGGDGGSSDGGDTSDNEYVSPNHPINEKASSWASLTAGLLARVMAELAAGGALPALAPALRRVCRHWRSVVDVHLESLSPNIMKVRAINTRFASLRSLHLDRCANIRNRDLLVLSRAPAAQHLHTLTLGDDRARPWVSNRGLASVCRITSLTRLILRDCMSLTNRGLAPLSSLTGLTCLSLRGCRKLTNQGIEALRGLQHLQHLSLYGVVRLSDKGLVPLAALPALRTLELGYTRVRDEGLGHAVRLGGLRAVVLVREEVTDTGVRQLSSLSGLTRLVMRDTVEVSGETLAVLLPALKELQVLDLQRNWSFNNMQLARCLPQMVSAPALSSLDLRATWVCEEGIAALARVPSLRRLALSPQHEHWSKYLHLLPQLQQLTALVLRNLPSLPYQLMEALVGLPDLRELDVSEPPPAVESTAAAAGWAAATAAAAAAVVAKEPLRPYTVAALARLRALRHLDLSRRNLLPDQALFLAMCMPSLERLIAVHCPLPPPAVARLWQQRPQLVVVAGSGTGTMHCLFSMMKQQQQQQQQVQQQQQQQGRQGQQPGQAGGIAVMAVGESCPLPPLDDADGFFGP